MTIDEACQRIITNKNLRAYVKRIRPTHIEDVIQSVALAYCELPQDKQFHVQAYIDQWAFITARNIAGANGTIGKYCDQPIDSVPDIESDEQYQERTLDLNGIYWYDREVFRLYMSLGSIRKLSMRVGIPAASLHGTIQKVKSELLRRHGI